MHKLILTNGRNSFYILMSFSYKCLWRSLSKQNLFSELVTKTSPLKFQPCISFIVFHFSQNGKYFPSNLIIKCHNNIGGTWKVKLTVLFSRTEEKLCDKVLCRITFRNIFHEPCDMGNYLFIAEKLVKPIGGEHQEPVTWGKSVMKDRRSTT